MRFRRTLAAATAALALAAGTAGCRSTSALEQDYVSTGVVVGSGDSTDSRIVARLYADALRGTGITVATDLGVGDRIDYVRALESGRVSVVPDDTASLLAFFQRSAPQPTDTAAGTPGGAAPATSPEAGAVSGLAEELSKALPAYLRISDAALASRDQVLTVTTQTAQRLGLHTVSDLAPHCGSMSAALVAGLVSGAQVREALADDYGCTFARVDSVDTAADAAAAADSGAVDVAGSDSISSPPGSGGLTVLEDDRDALPGGGLVPLYRAGSLGDAQVKALNAVAGELTTDDLAQMVRAVEQDGRPVDQVVGAWHSEHGV